MALVELVEAAVSDSGQPRRVRVWPHLLGLFALCHRFPYPVTTPLRFYIQFCLHRRHSPIPQLNNSRCRLQHLYHDCHTPESPTVIRKLHNTNPQQAMSQYRPLQMRTKLWMMNPQW